jgi:hypothetical protein
MFPYPQATPPQSHGSTSHIYHHDHHHRHMLSERNTRNPTLMLTPTPTQSPTNAPTTAPGNPAPIQLEPAADGAGTVGTMSLAVAGGRVAPVDLVAGVHQAVRAEPCAAVAAELHGTITHGRQEHSSRWRSRCTLYAGTCEHTDTRGGSGHAHVSGWFDSDTGAGRYTPPTPFNKRARTQMDNATTQTHKHTNTIFAHPHAHTSGCRTSMPVSITYTSTPAPDSAP